jgi:hypothetical protein
MKPQLDRLNKLTLAAESALAENDLPGFRALVQARNEELAKLPISAFTDSSETTRLDARLQAAAAVRMDGLRTRMHHLAHVNRTARAAKAAQMSAHQIDVSG